MNQKQYTNDDYHHLSRGSLHPQPPLSDIASHTGYDNLIMSAPQIPNLNTLRRGTGPSRSFGRGRAAAPSSSLSNHHKEQDEKAKDQIVQQTDQDASISRLSAVELAYLDDPFARLFATGPRQRRFPIINRGTYVRTTAIDQLVLRFLSPHPTSTAPSSPSPSQTPQAQSRQIISLGAGSDTRFFRLSSLRKSQLQEEQNASPISPTLPPFIYHELDFPSNTHQKITTIARSLALTSLIPSGYTISEDGTSLASETYHIHALDLRHLASSSPTPNASAREQLERAVDRDLPTLLISECCLVYLPPDQADAVVEYFTNHLFPSSSSSPPPPPSPSPSSPSPTTTTTHSAPQTRTQTPLALILYEPLNPHDAFGKTMVRNLAQRGIVLQTLHRYGSEEAQRERLRRHGFGAGTVVRTVDEIWEGEGGEGGAREGEGDGVFRPGIGAVERERVGALEMVDEVEEWRLLAGHYCVAWGWRDGGAGAGEGEGGGCCF
ncbi:MAG: hypothetical protein Q9202_004123 [Teloschistes flavicans]